MSIFLIQFADPEYVQALVGDHACINTWMPNTCVSSRAELHPFYPEQSYEARLASRYLNNQNNKSGRGNKIDLTPTNPWTRSSSPSQPTPPPAWDSVKQAWNNKAHQGAHVKFTAQKEISKRPMQIVDITRQTQLENQLSAMEIRMSQTQELAYQHMRDELEQLQRQIISVEKKKRQGYSVSQGEHNC